MRGGLGIELPMVVMPDDPCFSMGLADVWAGLEDAAWEQHFSSPENFGRDFEGIAALRDDQAANALLRTASFAAGSAPEEFAGRSALELQRRAERGAKNTRVYVERFASFFSQGRLVRRMFEQMNAEADPAFAGFRKAAELLFTAFRAAAEEECVVEEPSLLEWLYDDMITTLDVEKAATFFRWLGLIV